MSNIIRICAAAAAAAVHRKKNKKKKKGKSCCCVLKKEKSVFFQSSVCSFNQSDFCSLEVPFDIKCIEKQGGKALMQTLNLNKYICFNLGIVGAHCS